MDRIAQCHCGALRVQTKGEPEWVNLCHCRSCQQRTGALFHTGAYFVSANVRIEGVSRIHSRLADSGYEMHFHFCPDCGSNVYWKAARFPHHYGIAVGTFADPDFPLPTFSVWQESRHRWLSLPPTIQQFEQGRVGAPLGARGLTAASSS